MDAKEFAAALDGREYRSELSDDEERIAKNSGLVVVFGYSDDNIEFRGAIEAEVGSYGDATILVSEKPVCGEYTFLRNRLLEHTCDCEFCDKPTIVKLISKCGTVHAEWDSNGYAWFIDSTLAGMHGFDIMDDGEKYCRGIVFPIDSLPEWTS